MQLSKIAAYFDRNPVLDAKTGFTLCKGQLDLFDDSRRDGVGVDRRVLSTAPSALMVPTHRAIRLLDTVYVVGDRKSDLFDGAVIRDKYILHQASETLRAAPIHEHLVKPVTDIALHYAGVTWVKDLKLETWSSDPRDMFAFYVAANSPLDVDCLLRNSEHCFRVRASFLTAGGFKLLEANRLQEGALATATYFPSSSSFDPVQGKRVDVSGTQVNALLMHFHDDYEYLNPAVERYEPGDTTLRVSQSAVDAKVGDHYLHSNKRYRVVTAYKLPDGSWSLHGKAVNR